MNKKDDCSNGCSVLIFILLIAAIFAIPAACGYHLQWSWWNGDFIWVDKEGKTK